MRVGRYGRLKVEVGLMVGRRGGQKTGLWKEIIARRKQFAFE